MVHDLIKAGDEVLHCMQNKLDPTSAINDWNRIKDYLNKDWFVATVADVRKPLLFRVRDKPSQCWITNTGFQLITILDGKHKYVIKRHGQITLFRYCEVYK